MDTKNCNIQLFWSADDISKEVIYSILDQNDFPRDRVGIKLDRLFLTKYGLECIREIQENFRVPVFADAKIVEIPKKTLDVVKLHLEYQPYMLNVMAGACDTFISPFTDPDESTKNGAKIDVLHDFANLCAEAGTRSCAVTILTSKTPYAASHEFNVMGAEIINSITQKIIEILRIEKEKTNSTPSYNQLMELIETPHDGQEIVETAVLNYVQLMEECGLTDVVCSPKEIAMIVKNGCQMDINTPGVRLPGSSNDDQNRVDTPHNAIATGAKRLVIGRDIYRSGDDYKVVIPNIEKIFANIEGRS